MQEDSSRSPTPNPAAAHRRLHHPRLHAQPHLKPHCPGRLPRRERWGQQHRLLHHRQHPGRHHSNVRDADRNINTGYSYDNLGRTLTVPAADAISTGVTGNFAVGYYDNDMTATLTQGGQTRNYTLDPSRDRITGVDDGTTQHLNIYTGTGDSPAWTITQPVAVPARTPANTSWERHITGPDGLLAGTQTSAGTIAWNITDTQGSTIATTPGTNTTPTPGTTWTEYGTPRDPSKAGTYGWLGTHQRSTDTLVGLTLMGVRLYNPTTGRFLTMDPVYDGNANPYTYPTDPINKSDTDGKRWRHHHHYHSYHHHHYRSYHHYHSNHHSSYHRRSTHSYHSTPCWASIWGCDNNPFMPRKKLSRPTSSGQWPQVALGITDRRRECLPNGRSIRRSSSVQRSRR